MSRPAKRVGRGGTLWYRLAAVGALLLLAGNAMAQDPHLDLAAGIREYGSRMLVGASLMAWGVLAPDQFGTVTVDLLPGDPRPYNQPVDRAGTIVTFLTMGTAAAGRVSSGWPNVPASLSVSSTVVGSAYASRSYLKAIFRRPRPSAIASGETGDLDDLQSFPSGHTLLAWASVGDALVGTVRGDVQSWVLPVVVVEAVSVAALRIAAGEHYLGDVIAGAIAGLSVGSAAAILMLAR